MDNCCSSSFQNERANRTCPSCGQKGKDVPLITLKALLKASALETIQPESSYSFCSTPSCDLIYFSISQSFSKDFLKVRVFQKDRSLDIPVCYCFNWTRARLTEAMESNLDPIGHIREHVQANRCGCEVNNPQGACCLGNVTAFIRS